MITTSLVAAWQAAHAGPVPVTDTEVPWGVYAPSGAGNPATWLDGDAAWAGESHSTTGASTGSRDAAFLSGSSASTWLSSGFCPGTSVMVENEKCSGSVSSVRNTMSSKLSTCTPTLRRGSVSLI
jgi:hypothetical protein